MTELNKLHAKVRSFISDKMGRSYIIINRGITGKLENNAPLSGNIRRSLARQFIYYAKKSLYYQLISARLKLVEIATYRILSNKLNFLSFFSEVVST